MRTEQALQPGSVRSLGFAIVLIVLVSAFTLAQSSPVPFIDQPLVPMSAAPGGAGFTLTVNGGNFVSGSVVKWNGSALPTTFVSKAQLTATVAASDIATAHTAWVTVTNPGPGGGVSGLSFFPIAEPESGVVVSATPYSSYSAAVTADFNGDGKLDLAVLTYAQPNTVSILLGNGDGTFKTPTATYPVYGTPFVVGDFNGDGKIDLIAGTTVLFGKGDGTFTAGPSLSQYFAYMVAGDFNGDGKLDLAGVDDTVFNSPTLVVMLGNGNGTFQSLTPVPLAPYCFLGGKQTICAGSVLLASDFNGDGVLDLAVLTSTDNSSGNVVVFLGNGDGTFQVVPPPGCDTNGMWFTAADFNGDGKQDLGFIGQINGIDAYTLLGNGDGTCTAGPGYVQVTYSGPIFPGDFNGDGKLDLATSASVALGDGEGGFSALSSYGLVYNLQAVGDFNNDGRLDLVGAGSDAGVGQPTKFSVLLQTVAPVVTKSTPVLNFSTPQAVGTTSPAQMATISNTGNATLAISSIKIAGADAGDFAQTNNCGSSLAVGASCTIRVTFSPKGGGTRTATVQITDNAPGSPQVIVLSGTVQDFFLNVTSQTSLTVTPGQAANYALGVNSLNGFSGTVKLSCSGEPAQSTCSVSPSSVTLNSSGTSATANVVVVTTGASASLVYPNVVPLARNRFALWLAFPGLVGLVLLAGFGRRSGKEGRRWAKILALLAVLILAISWSACGGGSSSSSGGGTPAGNYTVTVTGTFTSGSVALTHTTKLTLVVN